MAKKAAELMQHQQEIEKRVSQRWGDVSAAGDSWAGQYLPAVEVRRPCVFGPSEPLAYFGIFRLSKWRWKDCQLAWCTMPVGLLLL